MICLRPRRCCSPPAVHGPDEAVRKPIGTSSEAAVHRPSAGRVILRPPRSLDHTAMTCKPLSVMAKLALPSMARILDSCFVETRSQPVRATTGACGEHKTAAESQAAQNSKGHDRTLGGVRADVYSRGHHYRNSFDLVAAGVRCCQSTRIRARLGRAHLLRIERPILGPADLCGLAGAADHECHPKHSCGLAELPRVGAHDRRFLCLSVCGDVLVIHRARAPMVCGSKAASHQ
jgi:hypothetical protein